MQMRRCMSRIMSVCLYGTIKVRHTNKAWLEQMIYVVK